MNWSRKLFMLRTEKKKYLHKLPYACVQSMFISRTNQFYVLVCVVSLGFTTALCSSESDGGSTANVLMLMLYWSEKVIRNSTYLTPNTMLIHKTKNRLTLITVFCFRVDPPSLLWRHMKPKNTGKNVINHFSGKVFLKRLSEYEFHTTNSHHQSVFLCNLLHLRFRNVEFRDCKAIAAIKHWCLKYQSFAPKG
jgi:hypothetical protein